MFFFFFQAEDGIRDLVRSRGLGDVYKRQVKGPSMRETFQDKELLLTNKMIALFGGKNSPLYLSLIHI